MPKGGLFDVKYRGWDSARVYNDLKDNDDDDSAGGDGTGTGQGFDEHDWDGAQSMDSEEVRELARDIDEAIRQGALLAGKTGSGGDRNLGSLYLHAKRYQRTGRRVGRGYRHVRFYRVGGADCVPIRGQVYL